MKSIMSGMFCFVFILIQQNLVAGEAPTNVYDGQTKDSILYLNKLRQYDFKNPGYKILPDALRETPANSEGSAPTSRKFGKGSRERIEEKSEAEAPPPEPSESSREIRARLKHQVLVEIQRHEFKLNLDSKSYSTPSKGLTYIYKFDGQLDVSGRFDSFSTDRYNGYRLGSGVRLFWGNSFLWKASLDQWKIARTYDLVESTVPIFTKYGTVFNSAGTVTFEGSATSLSLGFGQEWQISKVTFGIDWYEYSSYLLKSKNLKRFDPTHTFPGVHIGFGW